MSNVSGTSDPQLLTHGLGGRSPDLFTPLPPSPAPTITEELDALRATDPEMVRAELDREYGEALPSVLEGFRARPGPHLARLADGLQAYWDATLAGYWPAMRSALEEEVMLRARSLAAAGPDALLTELHDRVRWERSTLTLVKSVPRDKGKAQYFEYTVVATDQRLLLVPMAYLMYYISVRLPDRQALWLLGGTLAITILGVANAVRVPLAVPGISLPHRPVFTDPVDLLLRSVLPIDVRVLILTTFDIDEYVFTALRASASGFLLKGARPADLITAIRVVAAGDALLAPGVTRRLIEEFTRRPQPSQRRAASLAETTDREREVLALIGLGLSNTEIAAQLHVSLSTTKTHVGRLLMKLGARDRAQLVIAAYDNGLVLPATNQP